MDEPWMKTGYSLQLLDCILYQVNLSLSDPDKEKQKCITNNKIFATFLLNDNKAVSSCHYMCKGPDLIVTSVSCCTLRLLCRRSR